MSLRKSNDFHKQIVDFLRLIGGKSFTAADVVSHTNVSIYVVGAFLLSKMRQGFLTRTGTPGGRFRPGPGYQYHVVSMPETQKSKGEVAEAVWNLFVAARSPMQDRDVRNALNKNGRRKLSKNSVHTVTYRLYASGALIRGPKGYVLDRSVKKRPPTTG